MPVKYLKLKLILIAATAVLFCITACKKTASGPINEPLIYTATPAPIVHGGWRNMGSFFNHNCIVEFLFAIGDTCYFGVGTDELKGYAVPVLPSYFWKYVPATNTFYPLKNTPFSGTYDWWFAINDKGYCGIDNNLWEYDPTADSWTRKAPFPKKDTLMFPGTFTSAAKGYICGYNFYDHTLGYQTSPDDTVYEYDPAKDFWTSKAPFPGSIQPFPNTFSINNNGYILENPPNSSISCIAYNTDNNIWQGGASSSVTNGEQITPYTRDGKGYIYFGAQNAPISQEILEYDPLTNSWQRVNDFTGPVFLVPNCFGIGTKAYIGFGNNSTITGVINELWEYNP